MMAGNIFPIAHPVVSKNCGVAAEQPYAPARGRAHGRHGAEHAQWERYRHHINSTWDWDATDVRSLRMMRPILAQDPSASLHETLPASVKARIAVIETAKAKELRKVAKLAFAQLLGAKPTNEFGEWIYRGALGEDVVEVEIDYGSMAAQMRYDVRMPKFWTSRMGGPNYEILLGAGLGWWDQIEQGKEDGAFAVLSDVVRETVEICREVYQSGHARVM